MTTISYAAASTPVRADLVEAHEKLWQNLAEPGTWWTGAERVAIAAEVRKAWTCTLCTDRKAALSASAVDGQHDTHGVLPSPVVEMIHRVTTDPGRLSKDWYERLSAEGVEDTHYVEALGVVVRTVSVDSFCRGLGIPSHALPTSVPSSPSTGPNGRFLGTYDSQWARNRPRCGYLLGPTGPECLPGDESGPRRSARQYPYSYSDTLHGNGPSHGSDE